jgi:predicted RNase H-like HicB family nuclease
VGRTERLRLTILFDEADEDGWIVARVYGVPGAISEGRNRSEARENVVDALRLVLARDEINAPPSCGAPLELDLQKLNPGFRSVSVWFRTFPPIPLFMPV